MAASIATAGAIRLYALYADLGRQSGRKTPGDYRTTNDFPLTYFGVGTLVAAVVALLLFTGAGLILARKPSGRRMVVTGAIAYALAVVLSRTTDDRPFVFYSLAIETAICVIGLILAIGAAIAALSSSTAVPGVDQSLSASAGSRAALVATECTAALGGLYAGLVAWGFSGQIKYTYFPITTRMMMFAAAVVALLLIGGVIALMARAAAGRLMVAIGGFGLLVIGLLREVGKFIPLPDPLRYMSIVPYFGGPAATMFTVVVVVVSLATLAGALSKPVARVLNSSN